MDSAVTHDLFKVSETEFISKIIANAHSVGQSSIVKVSPGRYKICVSGDRPEQNQYSDVFEVKSVDVGVRS
jgi:hypothetical protein